MNSGTAFLRCAAAAIGILGLGIASQLPAAADASSVKLSGNAVQVSSSATLVGRVAQDQIVNFAITLPLRNEAALDTLLAKLYDPSDPLYGEYLTSAEFTEQFGPTKSDYDAVKAYAVSAGFTVTAETPGRTILDLSAPASVVQPALKINLAQYKLASGRVVQIPDADPTVPAAIAPLIRGFVGLDTLAQAVPHSKLVPLTALTPHAGTGSGPGSSFTPNDIATAYGVTYNTTNGAGQTIGQFQLDSFTQSDITQFETQFGLPNVTIEKVLIDGATGAVLDASGGSVETTLDIEFAIGAAPGITKLIDYETINGSGILDGYQQIATENRAKIVSSSWGIAEDTLSSTFLNSESAIFKQMATQGQSMFGPAGDNGAYDDSTDISKLAVDDPASQPYVTGVGGTALKTNGAGGSYSSETTWNDGSVSAGAGGGGISSFWPIPSWQTAAAASDSEASKSFRNTPDVSLNADRITPYVMYYEGNAQGVGGTSCSSPIFAAYTAIINQKRAANAEANIGFLNPAIYPLAAGARYATDFHDIKDNSTNLYYHAVTGYDLATGLGSLNAVGLFADLAPPVAQNPVPTVTGLSPNSAVAGGTALIATITGTNFVSGASVTFGGTTLPATVASSTSLTFTVPASAITSTGNITVKVTNPAPGGGTSGALTFTVAAHPNPVPTITALSTNSTMFGSPAFTLTITGTNFVSGATVSFGSTTLTATVSSATSLSVSVPATAVATAGTVSVSVTNPAPGGGASNTLTFTVTGNPVPAITSLSPASAPAGAAAFTLTIAGSNFVSGSKVSFNSVILTPSSVTASSIAVSVPASAVSAPGTFNVTVTNPTPGGGTSSAQSFAVTIQFPSGLNFMALPYNYGSTSPDTIFGYSGVRLAVYQPTLTAYQVTPNGAADTVLPGVGYWVRFPSTELVSTVGTPASTSANFSIALSAGWNQIADPFMTSVPVDNLEITSGGQTQSIMTASASIVGLPFYSYSNSTGKYVADDLGGTLQPYTGYWIYAFSASTLVVPHP